MTANQNDWQSFLSIAKGDLIDNRGKLGMKPKEDLWELIAIVH
jgi:hypothetical protein